MNQEIERIKDQAFSAYAKHKYQDALSGFQKCLEHFESEADQISTAEMRNNIAVVLIKLKQPDKALSILEKTDDIFASAGDKRRQAMALSNMATALESLNQKEEALEFYEKSLDILKPLNETDMKQDVLRRISDLQIKTGRSLQALASIDSALDSSDTHKLKDSIFRRLLQFLRHRFMKF